MFRDNISKCADLYASGHSLRPLNCAGSYFEFCATDNQWRRISCCDSVKGADPDTWLLDLKTPCTERLIRLH